jgi:asparagine synthase (glutamine-hydrolysing)
MLGRLAHRGPDGSGIHAEPGVAVGSVRLAVLDPSDAGRQPFASPDGRLQLLHNGEIYNYRELRAELEASGHRFRSGTDTEVILAAYSEWGERCVERFNGMWAFALWDGGRRTLFCSRDRFGVKPFYYRLEGDRLVFASELKAFTADPRTALRVNAAAVRDYLLDAALDHTDATFFEGIVRLPPAHSLTFGREGLRIRRHWRLEPRDPPPGDPASALRDLLVDAVRLRLRSDVSVGTCLSGGLDSSAVACVVDHLRRTEDEARERVGARQQTFTAYFDVPAFDERPYARAVVERTDSEPHWISFSDADLVQDLPRIVEAQDEPFGSTSIAAQWYVMRAAREAGVTVLLDGQGGDESLAGYRAFFGFRFADLLLSGRVRELTAEAASFRRLHGRGVARVLGRSLLPEAVVRRARARLTGSTSLLHADLRMHALPGGSDGYQGDRLRRQMALVLTRRGLPELLRYEDRNSMAHSLEARLPFLDYRLVELVFSLDAGLLIERGRTKTILRRALGDLLPTPVRERVDKLGFVTPEGQWMRGRLGEFAADVFASRSFAERGFIDARAARKRLERHRRGEVSAGFELWRALNVELWAQTFLDR